MCRVNLKTVDNMEKAVIAGKGTDRKSGSGAINKKHVFAALHVKVEQDHTVQQNMNPNTIKTSVNIDLGLKSFVRTIRHLLTAVLKSRD